MSFGVSSQHFRPAVDGGTRQKGGVQVCQSVVEMIAPVARPQIRDNSWCHVDGTVEGSSTSRGAC